MEKIDALAALRDIHLPPPPPGLSVWSVDAAASGLTLALIVVALSLARWRNGWASAVKSTLAGLDPYNDEALTEAAKILRRAAIAQLGPAAGKLQGDDWLAALDSLFHTRLFSDGAGRAFADDLYRASGNEASTPPVIDKIKQLAARRAWLLW